MADYKSALIAVSIWSYDLLDTFGGNTYFGSECDAPSFGFCSLLNNAFALYGYTVFPNLRVFSIFI